MVTKKLSILRRRINVGEKRLRDAQKRTSALAAKKKLCTIITKHPAEDKQGREM